MSWRVLFRWHSDSVGVYSGRISAMRLRSASSWGNFAVPSLCHPEATPLRPPTYLPRCQTHLKRIPQVQQHLNWNATPATQNPITPHPEPLQELRTAMARAMATSCLQASRIPSQCSTGFRVWGLLDQC